MEKIAEAFQFGGIWMYMILIVSIIALGIIIERFYHLYKHNINGKALMGQVEKLIKHGNIERAIKLCNNAPNAALAKVVRAGLVRANKSEAEIMAAVEEATLEVVPLITKRIDNLPILANIATLMGLLGTIIGMIAAFSSLSAVSADKRQAALSKGIAVAMYTTAFGLIVAIPVLLFHILIQNLAKKIVSEIDEYSVKLENRLVERLKAGLAQGNEARD